MKHYFYTFKNILFDIIIIILFNRDYKKNECYIP